MLQTGRSYTVGSGYRYGFNGMERTDELKGEGNSYTTEFRELDPRLGRWFSMDPVSKIHESPYSWNSNNPLWTVDPSGADSIFYNQSGKEVKELRIKSKGNDSHFVEHKGGNKSINGKNYYEGLTYESLFGDKSNPQRLFDRVDYYWFHSNEFMAEQVDNYTPDIETRYNFGTESPEEKRYDFKNRLLTNIPQDNIHTAYMFQGILLNRNEAGNVYWGAAANKVGWGLGSTLFLVHMFTLFDEKEFDNPAEQYAIRWGWRYFEHWRENTEKGKAALSRQKAAQAKERERFNKEKDKERFERNIDKR